MSSIPANRNPFFKRIWEYAKTNFSKNNIIKKLIFFSIGFVVVLVPSLVLNILISKGEVIPGLVTGIERNDGIAFGIDIGFGWMIALRVIISIILFIAILLTNEWWTILFISMAFTGGLFNLFDGIINEGEGGVLDYIDNSWLGLSGNYGNVPDYAVVVAFISVALGTIIDLIVSSAKDRANKKLEEAKESIKPTKDATTKV